ncbi:MAG: hypothetical protein AAF235_07465 [Planctomycetota bacterium]
MRRSAIGHVRNFARRGLAARLLPTFGLLGLGVVAIGAERTAVSVSASGADVIREGSGERREKLDEMELAPFDASLLDGLTGWHGGGPLTPAETDGKVVVIYTWSSVLSTSQRPLGVMKRLQAKHADDGLVLVGLHPEAGYDAGKALADRRRIGFRIARDTDGKVREALLSDQDPDFYIIDRSGQLRFADVDTASVETAVLRLLGESAEFAAGMNDRLEQSAAEREAEMRRLDAIRRSVSLSDLPDIPFEEPGPRAYEDADWPAFPQPGNNRGDDEAEAFAFEFPEQDKFAPERPNRKGKATLIYFWIPDLNASREFFTQLDLIQKDFERDLVVIGALMHSERQPNARGEQLKRIEEETERGNRLFAEFHRTLPVSHFLYNNLGTDEEDSIQADLDLNLNGQQGVTNLPFYAVVDSAGMVRWWGSVRSRRASERFQTGLQRVLEVDPGVLARRAAEDAYINERVEERVRRDGSGDDDS